jgi:hypothetical protein
LKAFFATDKTDNYGHFFSRATCPAKTSHRFANRYLDIYPDIAIVENMCPKGLTVKEAACGEPFDKLRALSLPKGSAERQVAASLSSLVCGKKRLYRHIESTKEFGR